MHNRAPRTDFILCNLASEVQLLSGLTSTNTQGRGTYLGNFLDVHPLGREVYLLNNRYTTSTYISSAERPSPKPGYVGLLEH